MKFHWQAVVFLPFLFTLTILTVPGQGQETENCELANQAFAILRKRCFQCHGAETKVAGFRVQERDSLLADRGEGVDPYVKPGDIGSSELWLRIGDLRDMPPALEDSGGLPKEELDTLKSWIEAGAPPACPDEREFISEVEILKNIHAHLSDTNRNSRDHQRYFTITHLHNNPSVTEDDLKLYRAAFSKAINSLSLGPEIIVPEAIDPETQTIYCVDLRDLRINITTDIARWEELIDAYPYGLIPGTRLPGNPRDLFEDIRELCDAALFDGITHIRADWFVVRATRPPLYHTLLKIPETFDEFAKELDVDVEENFSNGTLKRSGMFESGVSAQNRLVEVHRANRGLLWVSYDFKKNARRGNLARFPLGPKFDDNKFNRFAFEHDGGEIIWELPNGLHAYMLVDDAGNRIDSGPIEIVWDSSHTSGSPLIVNGVSCMSCHRKGTIDLKDDILTGHALFNNTAVEKVAELYATRPEMDAHIKSARSDFLRRLEQAIGPFLFEGGKGDTTRYPEPVSHVARLYEKNLTLKDAASELGFEDPQSLRSRLDNPKLKAFGIGPLLYEGGSIKRAFWEAEDDDDVVFQSIARELGLGLPID